MRKLLIISIQVFMIFSSVSFYLFKGSAAGWPGALPLAFLLTAGALAVQILYLHSVRSAKNENKLTTQELFVASTQVSAVSEEISLTIQESSAVSGELFRQTKQMAQLSAGMKKNLAEMYDSVDNMLALSQKTNEAGEEMEEAGKACAEVVRSSIHELSLIVSAVCEIQNNSRLTMKNMQELRGTSQDILKIIEVVENISREMHLVTLNATIEAARAGQAGKCFSVVVEEMHRLSASTGEAVEQIGSLVNGIEQKITEVYKGVEEGTTKVEEGVKTSHATAENLKNVKSSFATVLEMVRRIFNQCASEAALAAKAEASIEAAQQSLRETAESVLTVYKSAYAQKQSFANIQGMGRRLDDASKSLSSLVDSSVITVSGLSDKKVEELSGTYFHLMEEEIVKAKNISVKTEDVHREFLEAFMRKHDLIEAAWTNGTKGRFICSIPEAGIANASVREWFQKSIAGERFVTPVYISAITKNPCITLSMPFSDKDGNILGVIGVDLNLKNEELSKKERV